MDVYDIVSVVLRKMDAAYEIALHSYVQPNILYKYCWYGVRHIEFHVHASITRGRSMFHCICSP